MIILGISAFYHDSAVCLLVNGKIIFCIQEERFSRVKHDERFPEKAIKYIFKNSKFNFKDIDYVVFYDKPLLKFERLLLGEDRLQYFFKRPSFFFFPFFFFFFRRTWLKERLIKNIVYNV